MSSNSFDLTKIFAAESCLYMRFELKALGLKLNLKLPGLLAEEYLYVDVLAVEYSSGAAV